MGRLRWFFTKLWRTALRRGGGFAQSEASPRASSLTTRWETQWPGSEPMGDMLRERNIERWVRFHSLPGSKRYAMTGEEKGEILRRNHILLEDLVGLSEEPKIRVIGEDFDVNDFSSGQLKKHLPGAWPWRTYLDPDDDAPAATGNFRYFWVSSIESVDELDGLLALVADDVIRFIVTDTDMTWIFAPYDGGTDVFLPTTSVRNEFRAQHQSWLSGRADGL